LYRPSSGGKMTEEFLKIIHDIQELFIQKGFMLSVAESCTGGLISHYLTYLPGASRFFEAGIVTYSELSKEKILGVSSATIASCGMVSPETAKEMAERIRLLTAADYALSTTGNLGPDVLEEKEKGLVYVGISTAEKTLVRELRLRGDRIRNRKEAVFLSLKFLRDELSGIKQ